jgi:hypothetical protein
MQRRRVRGGWAGGWWRNGRQDPRGTGTRAWLLHEAKGARGAPWMHAWPAAGWIDRGDLSDLSLSLSLHYPCGHAPPPMLAVGRARTPCVRVSALCTAAGMGKRCNRASAATLWPAGMGTGWAERDRPMPTICWVEHRDDLLDPIVQSIGAPMVLPSYYMRACIFLSCILLNPS